MSKCHSPSSGSCPRLVPHAANHNQGQSAYQPLPPSVFQENGGGIEIFDAFKLKAGLDLAVDEAPAGTEDDGFESQPESVDQVGGEEEAVD